MTVLLLIGLAILLASCLSIDFAASVSLNAAAAVYALGLGGAALTLAACVVVLSGGG